MRIRYLVFGLIVVLSIELFFGPCRVLIYYFSSGPLGESGQRYQYYMNYSRSGLVGEYLAREDCFNKFKLVNKSYNSFQFLFNKTIWKNAERKYFIARMPLPDIETNTMLAWNVSQSASTGNKMDETYLITEFSPNNKFSGIGLNGETTSDSKAFNLPYKLKGNYLYLNGK